MRTPGCAKRAHSAFAKILDIGKLGRRRRYNCVPDLACASHKESFMSILQSTASRAQRYLDALPERRVAPAPDAVARLAAFDTPLPDAPGDPEQVLAELDDLGS